MKYFKTENGSFGCQSKVPSYATEITEAEYYQLMAEFEAKQKAIADYVEKVKAGEMTLEEVPQEYRAEVEAIINVPEPEIEEEATEADYLNALEELGVDTSEEG